MKSETVGIKFLSLEKQKILNTFLRIKEEISELETIDIVDMECVWNYGMFCHLMCTGFQA